MKELDQTRVDVSQLKAQIKQAEDAYETAMADKTKDSAGVKELKDQVARLENELQRTNEAMIRLLRALERRFGEDLDQDGRVG